MTATADRADRLESRDLPKPARPARAPMPLDASVMLSIVAVGAAAVLAAIAALVGWGWDAAVGVAAGGLVATANLWAFAYIGRGVLAGGRYGRLYGVLSALKFLALLFGAYLLVRFGIASGVTLAAGYAALPLGITVANLIRPKDDDVAEPPRA